MAAGSAGPPVGPALPAEPAAADPVDRSAPPAGAGWPCLPCGQHNPMDDLRCGRCGAVFLSPATGAQALVERSGWPGLTTLAASSARRRFTLAAAAAGLVVALTALTGVLFA